LPEAALALGTRGQALLAARWLILTIHTRDRVYVQAWSVSDTPTQRCLIELEGASHASVHLDANVLTIADNCGRVVVLDLTSGTRFADLRLHVG
jgi:hypothetical protein